MSAILIFQKIATSGITIVISAFTNDLVIHAKQVNYFEMFLLSLLIEIKNSALQNMTLPFDIFCFKTLKLNQILGNY